MKSSVSESEPFQSGFKGEILGQARRKERLRRSKLKQAFLIDSNAELFLYLKGSSTKISWHKQLSCSSVHSMFDLKNNYIYLQQTFAQTDLGKLFN